MIHDFIAGLFVFASLFGIGQPTFGVFSDPFLSIQLAASPANGECLFSDGTANYWDPCPSGGGGGGGTGMATTSIDTEAELETILTDVTNVFTNNDTIGTANGGTGLSNPGTAGIAALVRFNGASGASTLGPGSDGTVLRSLGGGTDFSFGALDLADSDAVGTSILAIANGGTGWANIQANAIPYGNGTTRLSTTTQGTNGQILGLVSGIPSWVSTTTFSGGVAYSAGNVTNTMTAGDGLTRTVDDIDCDTASSSVFGCLSTTDWATFNSKLASYDAWTHPASGVSATTSGILITAASSTFNGSLNILGNATATNATTTNLYVTNPPTFSTLTSALLLTGTGGLLAEYAGTTCTNQVATALSALGAATCTTITSSYVDSTILTTSSNSIDADAINGDTTDDDDLDVAAGGTGVSTITGLLQGNGTSDVTGISNSSTVGQILRVTGASTYAWGALDLDDSDAFTGTLPIANTQLVAGRSVTLSTDTVDADSELYTFAIGANLFATSTSGIATTTEFDLPAIYVPFAATITGFNCFADTAGTSTVMATVASNPLSAGTNILYTTGVNCGAQVHTSTTTFSSTAVSAGSWIRFYVSSAGSRPMVIFPFFTATKDD